MRADAELRGVPGTRHMLPVRKKARGFRRTGALPNAFVGYAHGLRTNREKKSKHMAKGQKS
jgi:hypothetical protein